MPVYEYQCKACSRDFEYQQRMSDPDKTTCEVCGGELTRLISRTAFALKGGGWYKDLYASPKPDGDKAGSKDGAAEAKPSGNAAARADTSAAGADKAAAKSSDSGGGSSGSSSSGSSSGGSSGSSSGGSSSSVSGTIAKAS